MPSRQTTNQVSIPQNFVATIPVSIPQTRNQRRHQQVVQQSVGHWDPIQPQEKPNTVGVWLHGWRILQTQPKVFDTNCWEVSKELNWRYTQYIQLDFSKQEVRIFVHDKRRYRSRTQSIPGSFMRFTMGSCDQLRTLANSDPEHLQQVVVNQFGGYFKVQ